LRITSRSPLRHLGSGVGAAGEAGVAARADDPRLRRQLAHQLGAAVAGLVLDDDQLVALAQLRQQGGKGLAEIVAALVGDDQD
jgi:phage I-like protein